MHWACLSLKCCVHRFTMYLYPVLFIIFICTANAVDVIVYHWQYALNSWCIILFLLNFNMCTHTCKTDHRCFPLWNNRADVRVKHVWPIESTVCPKNLGTAFKKASRLQHFLFHLILRSDWFLYDFKIFFFFLCNSL